MSVTKAHTTLEAARFSVPKIVTAGLSGLAGGAVLASTFSPAIGVLFLGSLCGAAVTGFSEYQREKKMQPRL